MSTTTLIELEERAASSPQFAKCGGLLPVAVQETGSLQLLMLVSVNEEALMQTLETRWADPKWSTHRLLKKWTTEANSDRIELNS